MIDRHRIVSVSLVGLALLGGIACMQTPASQCDDGRLCPADRACDNVHHGCVLPEQIEQCAGRADGSDCAFRDVPGGECFDGVCFPVGCGNGVLEGQEVCDDGNRLHGDGCSADCLSNEECGNKVIDTTRGESCDDGKHCQSLCDDGTPCNSDADCSDIGSEICTVGASCENDTACTGIGDGACKPRDGGDCQANCINPACGDGVLDREFLEACDLGTANADEPDAQCRTNCQPQRCGDLIVDSNAGENCDDGNLFPGDGCSGACVIEECGNGVIDLKELGESFLPSEDCDDGENDLNHDGCAVLCTREKPGWTQALRVSPTPRFGHDMVYDAARGKVVLFGGGENTAFESTSETWEYDPTTGVWAEITTTGRTPLVAFGQALAYDAARGKVVLFGGFLRGTWEYDGARATWTEVVSAEASPPQRTDHAMVYDSARDRIVLSGGAGHSDTWEYDGAARVWSHIGDFGPARRFHAMVYDTSRAKVVAFGGVIDVQGTEFLDDKTLEYDGFTGQWKFVNPTGTPPSSRSNHAMAYDPIRKKTVLFGGRSAFLEDNDETWEYDALTATWSQVTPSGLFPSPRKAHSMTYDLSRRKVVLFGGTTTSDNTPNSETWEYDASSTTWTKVVQSLDAPPPRSSFAMAHDSTRRKIVLFGGGQSLRLNDTWEYDDATGVWSEVTPSGSVPSARRFHAMAYDADRGRMVMFGGRDDSNVFLDDTWEYEVATKTWTEISIGGDKPPPQIGHAMAYDAARKRVVLVGINETWEYDGVGAKWSRTVTAVGQPSQPFSFSPIAYDARRRKIVLLNQTAPLATETWEYDGVTSTWTQITPIGESPIHATAIVYNPALRKIVAGVGETWLYDGATWEEVSPLFNPPLNSESEIVLDAVRGVDVAFDGLRMWTFQYGLGGSHDVCTTGFDGDGDGLRGCSDPDCWSRCTPLCPPFSTPDWPNDCDSTAPRCGDGVCNVNLETSRLCPSDCGEPTPICGDFHCDTPEDAASCPGDCTP